MASLAAKTFRGIRQIKSFQKLLNSACTPRNVSHQTLPSAAYGGRHTVTMLAGDGVGPELMGHLKEVFRFAGAPVDFEDIQLDASVTDESEVENALLSIKRNGVAIKGNVLQPGGQKSRNVELRKELDLFANIVHCKSIPGIRTRHSDIDIVIIRENTEGEYKQLEHENVKGVVESLKIITRENSTRIAQFAFEFARQHGRKKVTAVHKANIMKLGDGMFLHTCEDVAKKYPDIQFEAMIIDNCSMQMVSKPQQFDVMVMPNLYGNIVSNIGAGLVGGPGIVSGMNLGENYAVFEMGTRNVGIAIKNMNIANPCAILLAGAEMLEYLGLDHHSVTIKDAVYKVISDLKIHTPDLGGTATTTDMIQAVIKEVQANYPVL